MYRHHPVPSSDRSRASAPSRRARSLPASPPHHCGPLTSPTTTAKRTSSMEPPLWTTQTAGESTPPAAHATAPATTPHQYATNWHHKNDQFGELARCIRNSSVVEGWRSPPDRVPPLVAPPQPPRLHCTQRRTRSHVVPPSSTQLRRPQNTPDECFWFANVL